MKNSMRNLSIKTIAIYFVFLTYYLSPINLSADTVGSHRLDPVGIKDVDINDSFWQSRYDTWRKVTVYDVLEKFEKDGAFRNFDRISGKVDGKHEGPPWYDGLIYETIRGASDLLVAYPDKKLEKRLEKCVTHIIDACDACPDGYMMTYTMLEEPDHRWGENDGNLRWQHDVYNAGALVEAGIHYYKATGNTNLLEAAVRMADHMVGLMGESPKRNIVPAHSLPEESFVSLYQLLNTNHKLSEKLDIEDSGEKYLKLVEFWMKNRGNHKGRLDYGSYAQDHAAAYAQPTIEGHAVRATLMCAGLAASAHVNNNREYISAARRLWDNMVGRKMHITGGVGAYSEDEKFGSDYELPNDAYLETCAAIGAGFYHYNMNMLTGDWRYVDELERVLYNNIINGVSIAGNSYYYQNPLESHAHHRWGWHGCPCCPPMLLKFIGALPGYIYATDESGIYVNLFIGSNAQINYSGQSVKIKQQTSYPWKGRVSISVEPESNLEFTVYVRLPGWARGQENPYGLYNSDNSGRSLLINGKPINNVRISRGYAAVTRKWKKGDKLDLILKMEPRRVYANNAVAADKGHVAIQSGPLVYCLENVDNVDISYTYLPKDSKLSMQWEPGICGGINTVTAKAYVRYKEGKAEETIVKAVPFYCQDNRPGGGSIKVWLPETAEMAKEKTLPTITNKSEVSSSHCFSSDTNDAVNDGLVPKNSDDHSIPRHTWWDHKNTVEWLEYDFADEVEIFSSSVYWWDDTPSGGECTLPESWSLEYMDTTGNWHPVSVVSGYQLSKDCFNKVKFKSVKAKKLKLNVKLRSNYSAGVLEWQVN